MNTISAAASAQPSIARPVATPAAPKASDPLDFTTIDTADKALALPALNPVAFASFSSVITACAMSSCGLHGSLAMTVGQGGHETQLTGQYKLDFSEAGMSLQCTGKDGAADYQETWNYGFDGSFTMKGRIGNSDESLKLDTSEHNGTGRMTGHIGSVPVDLAYSGQGFEGQVGDKTVHINTQMQPAQNALYKVSGEGSGVKVDGLVTRSSDNKGMSVDGNSTVGPYQVKFEQSLTPELPAKQ